MQVSCRLTAGSRPHAEWASPLSLGALESHESDSLDFGANTTYKHNKPTTMQANDHDAARAERAKAKQKAEQELAKFRKSCDEALHDELLGEKKEYYSGINPYNSQVNVTAVVDLLKYLTMEVVNVRGATAENLKPRQSHRNALREVMNSWVRILATKGALTQAEEIALEDIVNKETTETRKNTIARKLKTTTNILRETTDKHVAEFVKEARKAKKDKAALCIQRVWRGNRVRKADGTDPFADFVDALPSPVTPPSPARSVASVTSLAAAAAALGAEEAEAAVDAGPDIDKLDIDEAAIDEAVEAFGGVKKLDKLIASAQKRKREEDAAAAEADADAEAAAARKHITKTEAANDFRNRRPGPNAKHVLFFATRREHWFDAMRRAGVEGELKIMEGGDIGQQFSQPAHNQEMYVAKVSEKGECYGQWGLFSAVGAGKGTVLVRTILRKQEAEREFDSAQYEWNDEEGNAFIESKGENWDFQVGSQAEAATRLDTGDIDLEEQWWVRVPDSLRHHEKVRAFLNTTLTKSMDKPFEVMVDYGELFWDESDDESDGGFVASPAKKQKLADGDALAEIVVPSPTKAYDLA